MYEMYFFFLIRVPIKWQNCHFLPTGQSFAYILDVKVIFLFSTMKSHPLKWNVGKARGVTHRSSAPQQAVHAFYKL